MSEEKCCTQKQTKTDIVLQKYRFLKSRFYLKLHGIWWGALWSLRLGKIYSITLCRLNLYRKYPDGRCGYCGVIK